MAKKTNQQGISWDYSAAPESTSHVRLKDQYELFIGGKWVKPQSGKYFETINPANEVSLARIAHADQSDVDLAVSAAKKAYDEVWSELSGKERGKYIFRIARLLQERAREFAVVETMDGGKPIREARDIDVPLACNHYF